MNYPVWYIPSIGGAIIIAVVAIVRMGKMIPIGVSSGFVVENFHRFFRIL